MEQPELYNVNIPKVAQCYICKAWRLEDSLSRILVPDQQGWIEKPCCGKCLKKIHEGE
jgi:hypothetical protein